MNSYAICGILIFITSLCACLFVLINDPRKNINIIWSIFTLFIALWGIGLFVLFGTENRDIALFSGRFINLLALYVPPLFLNYVYAFTKKIEKRIVLIILSYLLATIYFVYSIIYPSTFISNVSSKGGFLFYPDAGPLYFISLSLFLIFVSIGIINLFIMYLNATSQDKNKILYLFLAMFFGFAGALNTYFLVFNIPIQPFGAWGAILYVFIVTYSITKHHLMDISVIISRTVAELITITFLGSIYIASVWFYKHYISSAIDVPLLSWTILCGILVGQTQQRIRLFIQTTSDKVFLKGKYNYYKELSEIGSQIAQGLSVENILKTLHKAFYEVLEVSNPRIYIENDISKAEIKEYMTIKEPTIINKDLVLPCIIEGKLIAMIILGQKLSEDPYTDEDIRLLKNMANQTAVALDHCRLYEEMLKTQKQLLEADKLAALGRVAAGLAHEIKNPLAAIKGMAQSIDQNVDDPEFLDDYRDVVPKEVKRINNLVEDLLKLSKTKKSSFTQVNVSRLIDNTIKLFENRCKAHSIKVAKKLNQLPEIKADADQLTQVFTNLILNAIQAISSIPDGSRSDKMLTINSLQKESKIIVEILDTGQGMPEDQLKDIFEPFFSTKDEGMGLGLAISYRIIKDHGGEIEVESRVGVGTKFRVMLPV